MMQSNRARAGVVVVAIAVVVVLFVVLGGGDDSDEGATTATTERSAVSGKGDAKVDKENAQPTKEDAGADVKEIVVKGGEPVGGVQKLVYGKGEEIRFRVRSDVAEEVHVHGYDISEDVKAGDTASFDFAADIDGVFEVELEHSVVQIAELRVNP